MFTQHASYPPSVLACNFTMCYHDLIVLRSLLTFASLSMKQDYFAKTLHTCHCNYFSYQDLHNNEKILYHPNIQTHRPS